MVLFIILMAIGVATLSHVAPFPFLLDAANDQITVWRMPPTAGPKTIYLTFDDGPNPTATPELLDLLKEKNVRATFFLIGDYVDESTAPIVRRMFEEGHSVGQHSGDRWLLLKSSDTFAAKLRSDADKIQMFAGHQPCRIFRPHAGWRSLSMLRGAGLACYKVIGWSWMTWDWVWFRKRTPPRVSSQVLSHAAPGKIIVIHDGHHRNPRADRQYAIEATRRVVDGLSAEGYEFRTVCDPASNE
jgi:peptidoglycan/xylan/chitin deacetylase (PgdA/CDA1 family)